MRPRRRGSPATPGPSCAPAVTPAPGPASRGGSGPGARPPGKGRDGPVPAASLPEPEFIGLIYGRAKQPRKEGGGQR